MGWTGGGFQGHGRGIAADKGRKRALVVSRMASVSLARYSILVATGATKP